MNPLPPKLRLAIIASSLRRGGAEKQCVYIARALRRAGVDVHLYYLGKGGHYETVLRESGVPVHQIFHARRPWKILFELALALRRWRPDIVLVHQFGDLHYGATAGRLCGALVLGGVRSDGWYELRSYGWLTRLMLRLTHGFVANSESAMETLAAAGIASERMQILPNVIDLHDFDARSMQPFSVPLPAGRIIVAAVGSLHPCKRFDRFLEALALARKREPALAGVLAGADGGERAALEKRAADLGLTPQDLIFLGECDGVPALLTRVSMLVLSSEYEGFPNVVLEAMAARLPVITTAVGDGGMVVRHGETGYVVRPQDTTSMAGWLVHLAQSPSLRVDLGEAGRKRVEEEYAFESLSGLVIGVLHELAERHGKAASLETLQRHVPSGASEALPPAFIRRPVS